jgi:hypothetical protein
MSAMAESALSRTLTKYFFRGFLFLLAEALSSSAVADADGVAEPAARGDPVPFVVTVFFGPRRDCTRAPRDRVSTSIILASSSYNHQKTITMHIYLETLTY